MARGIEDNTVTRPGLFRLGGSLNGHKQHSPESQRTSTGKVTEPASACTVKSGTLLKSIRISDVALFEAPNPRAIAHRRQQNRVDEEAQTRPSRARLGSLSSARHEAQPAFDLTVPSLNSAAAPVSPPSSTTSKTPPQLWQDKFYRDLPKIKPLDVVGACKGSLQVVLAERERELDQLRAELRDLWKMVDEKDRRLDEMETELEERRAVTSGCLRCRLLLDGDE